MIISNSYYSRVLLLLVVARFAVPPSYSAADDRFTICMIGDSTLADKRLIPENPKREF